MFPGWVIQMIMLKKSEVGKIKDQLIIETETNRNNGYMYILRQRKI